MSDDINYSVHYSRWHTGSIDELKLRDKFYLRLFGDELSEFPKSISILDYGCGYGHLTYFLSNRFRTVTGVDSSEHQVKVAKRNSLPVFHLKNEDFADWCEEKKENFDVIFLMDVLEHIDAKDQISFIRSLSLTLKENGLFYIKVPNANSLLASRWRYIDWTHKSSFTEASLEFVLKNSNFMEIDYLDDETSIKPKMLFLPRKDTLPYYLKSFVRFIWRFYLYSEIGREALRLRLGVNLLAKARKIKSNNE